MPLILLCVNSLIAIFISNDVGNFENKHDSIRFIRAATSLFVWFKFFLLLRSMSLTAYLVQLIIQVFADIKVFLFILCITLVAFSDSFYMLRTNETEDDEN